VTSWRGQDSFAYQRCSGACAVEVHAGEAAAVTGTTIVHSRADGTTRGTDATTGRELWRRPADGKRPGRSPDSQGRTLALPLVFGTSERDFLTYFDPDVVRTVDPVSGRRTGARWPASTASVPPSMPPASGW
jgi:hypothetical protein